MCTHIHTECRTPKTYMKFGKRIETDYEGFMVSADFRCLTMFIMVFSMVQQMHNNFFRISTQLAAPMKTSARLCHTHTHKHTLNDIKRAHRKFRTHLNRYGMLVKYGNKSVRQVQSRKGVEAMHKLICFVNRCYSR